MPARQTEPLPFIAQGLLWAFHILGGTCFEGQPAHRPFSSIWSGELDGAGKTPGLHTWLKSLFSVSALWVSPWQGISSKKGATR